MLYYILSGMLCYTLKNKRNEDEFHGYKTKSQLNDTFRNI